MSYYEQEIICPKCGQYSKEMDTCEHCGALISRIREREMQQADNDRMGFAEDEPAEGMAPINAEPGVSFTAIVSVIILMAGIAAAVYYKSHDGETVTSEVVAAPSETPASAEAEMAIPEGTPIYNFARKKSAATAPSAAPKETPEAKTEEEPDMITSIADAIKAQVKQTAASAPVASPSPSAVPAAVPAAPPETSPASTATPTPPASDRPQTKLNAALSPITIGEGEISSNFGIKASESAPGKTAQSSSAAQTAATPPEAAAPKSGLGKRRVVAVDSSSFKREVLFHNSEPVLVDFYATWCGPCKRLAPQLEVFAGLNDGIKVVKLDIDQSKEMAMKYKINSVPTLILFKNGQEIGRNSGVPSMAELQASVQPHM